MTETGVAAYGYDFKRLEVYELLFSGPPASLVSAKAYKRLGWVSQDDG